MKKTSYNQLLAFININREFYYKLAYSYAHNNEEALFILEVSIDKALNTIKALYNPLAIKAWFYKIIVDIAFDYLNDKKRFIIVKSAEEIIIPKELEELVKQKIDEFEEKADQRRRSLIRVFSIISSMIIVTFIYTIIQILR